MLITCISVFSLLLDTVITVMNILNSKSYHDIHIYVTLRVLMLLSILNNKD